MTASFYWPYQCRSLLNDSQAALPVGGETSSSQHLLKWMGSPLSSAVFWEMTPTCCLSLAHAWLGPFPSLMWFYYFGWSQEGSGVCTWLARWISLIMWVASDGVAGRPFGLKSFPLIAGPGCHHASALLMRRDADFPQAPCLCKWTDDFHPQIIPLLYSVSFCLLLCVKL